MKEHGEMPKLKSVSMGYIGEATSEPLIYTNSHQSLQLSNKLEKLTSASTFNRYTNRLGLKSDMNNQAQGFKGRFYP